MNSLLGDTETSNYMITSQFGSIFITMIKLTDILDEIDDPCWKGYRQIGMKPGGDGDPVPNCVKAESEEETTLESSEEMLEFLRYLKQQPAESLCEATYRGRKVKLNKPMRGDVKKFKVYVKNPKTGKIVKVNFGDPNMRIKKSNPARRKSFRARHKCENPGPKTKARYWSCKKW
jgi:hypothetical protein